MLHHLTDRATALAAGIGLAVVILSFDAAQLGDGPRRWAALAAVAVAIAVGHALPVVRAALATPGLGPLPLGATLLAIALCVPETGPVYLPAVVLAALVGLELGARRQADIGWYAVAAGGIGWVGLSGAAGRPSALVGALFAWWAVLLVAIAVRAVPMRGPAGPLAVGVVGAAAAATMARTGGVAGSGWVALAAGAVIGVGSLALAAAGARFAARS